jgi:hypothetical protein
MTIAHLLAGGCRRRRPTAITVLRVASFARPDGLIEVDAIA